jgi:hypothetical protein
MGEITPKTANFYIFYNFYPLRIEYFGKTNKNRLLEKYRNLSDLILKEAAPYLIYDTASWGEASGEALAAAVPARLNRPNRLQEPFDILD